MSTDIDGNKMATDELCQQSKDFFSKLPQMPRTMQYQEPIKTEQPRLKEQKYQDFEFCESIECAYFENDQCFYKQNTVDLRGCAYSAMTFIEFINKNGGKIVCKEKMMANKKDFEIKDVFEQKAVFDKGFSLAIHPRILMDIINGEAARDDCEIEEMEDPTPMIVRVTIETKEIVKNK